MFKKPAKIKNATPLKNSERKRLRVQIVDDFAVSPPEDGDLLMPEGLQCAKFMSHGDVPGNLYVDKSGDPLWFTLGKMSTSLIPTVYTLWKRPLLLSLSTPSPAMEKIMGGADLMMPGVTSMAHHSLTTLPSLAENSLVAVTLHRGNVPHAVGRITIPSDDVKAILQSDQETKGKAVIVLHSYQDTLWELGSKASPPERLDALQAPAAIGEPLAEGTAVDVVGLGDEQADGIGSHNGTTNEVQDSAEGSGSNGTKSSARQGSTEQLSAQDIDEHLHLSLLQTLAVSFVELPSSPLPLPATTFFTSHLQQNRPYWSPPLDVKKSSYKTLTKFLKSVEKDGLIKLKDHKGDVTVVSSSASHPTLASHKPFKTAGTIEAKQKVKLDREKEQASQAKPAVIVELWKPSGQAVAFFEALQKSTDQLYQSTEVRAMLQDYVAKHSLVHPRESQYIVLDNLLQNVLRKQGETVEFLRRDELLDRILDQMQQWYTLDVPGKDPVKKKGRLSPVSVALKMRQGRKFCTIVTNFEAFAINAEFLTEELKKLCASATTCGPIPGGSKGSAALEVMVQGKHLAIVRNLLMSQGVPKKYIDEADMTGVKKK